MAAILLAVSMMVGAFALPANAGSSCGHNTATSIHAYSTSSKGQLGHRIYAIYDYVSYKKVYESRFFRSSSSQPWTYTGGVVTNCPW